MREKLRGQLLCVTVTVRDEFIIVRSTNIEYCDINPYHLLFHSPNPEKKETIEALRHLRLTLQVLNAIVLRIPKFGKKKN